jgi:hypothetical protein
MYKYRETTKQAGHAKELKRLTDNHEVLKDAMGGLILAPMDLSMPGLRILDCATADGTSPRTRVDPFLFSLCILNQRFATDGISAPAYRHVAP